MKTLFHRYAPLSGLLHFLCACLLAVVSLSGAMAQAAPVISAAEKPVRLIRGLTLHRAGNGVELAKGDILETGAMSLQIEQAAKLIIAVAPNTKLYIANTSPLQISVLEGWVKLRSMGDEVQIASTLLQTNLKQHSVVLHAEADRSELFAEEGQLIVSALDAGKSNGNDVKVAQEQLVQRFFGQRLKDLPRPSKDFIAAMPKTFRDTLASSLKPGSKTAAPQAETAVQYADVSHWLNASLPAKKDWVKRFKPQLKDPAFRKALDAELGQSAEWKAILHPVVKKPADAVSGSTLY
ncbi:MAG: hypothetical protein RL748_439 [Pseudomonadota bacterium]|jgi:hypothetical protein